MANGTLSRLWRQLSRKKVYRPEQLEGNLRRCLNIWDLTALGLGSILGVGVYVLVGSVALSVAGPSIVLSFLIAAVSSFFAGLCYAEFGARVPKAGSTYVYTYVTMGEFVAFIIGWTNILDATFGAASVARGLSLYVDSLSNGTMSSWFTSVMPVGAPVSPYFDMLAFCVVITYGVVLAIGVRESSIVNRCFAALNVCIIVFIVALGATRATPENWRIPVELVPTGYGEGGFFPYGIWGMLRGAAICFYGLVGFEGICSSGEEVKNPRKTVPLAIITVLLLVFVAYGSVATVITMMLPYYQLDSVAAVATAFTMVGWDWARSVVTVGAIAGICASLFGAMFPLPRLLYAMSEDGLMPRCFARVSCRRSPVAATLLPTLAIAVLSAVLELEQLVTVMCIGTLVSYTIVALSVIVLRYSSSFAVPDLSSSWARQLLGCGSRVPTRTSGLLVRIYLVVFVLSCVGIALCTAQGALLAAAGLHGAALLPLLLIALQPANKEPLDFKTPLVPLIPCFSIYINIHLMILINVHSWIRVIIWILIGVPVYILFVCCYKRNDGYFEDDVKQQTEPNNKQMVQIVVESPTPPSTLPRNEPTDKELPSKIIRNEKIIDETIVKEGILITEEIKQYEAVIDHNEEKEAKIIDLLDQVLQAEEDAYGEVISLTENKEDTLPVETESLPHRPSLSELSEAGSDASLSNVPPSKYDVVAQVHREDLPRVSEEPEISEQCENYDEHEQVTFFNDSETSSRTDESGYSDTTDNNNLTELEEKPEEAAEVQELEEPSRIPTPPPPPPPPLDESLLGTNYFISPNFRKSYTIPSRPSNKSIVSIDEESKPRESIQSNTSIEDNNIVFGSARQMSFMSKLDNIFQNKMVAPEEERLKRSNSMGNVIKDKELSVSPERPAIFLDLQKEILAKDPQKLRHVEQNEPQAQPSDDDEDEPDSLSRENLKSKLESILASGGPKLLKPMLMKPSPPTPEEAYHTDNSSTESIPKLPKMEKNDTLKRQKDKFGAVLNSIKLNFNPADDV